MGNVLVSLVSAGEHQQDMYVSFQAAAILLLSSCGSQIPDLIHKKWDILPKLLIITHIHDLIAGVWQPVKHLVRRRSLAHNL